MTYRERLISLINEIQDEGICYGEHGYGVRVDNGRLADHLISNGVTIQRWIPVTERLPEENTAVIVATDRGDAFQCLYAYDGWDLWEGHIINITHWMPLPTAPEARE